MDLEAIHERLAHASRLGICWDSTWDPGRDTWVITTANGDTIATVPGVHMKPGADLIAHAARDLGTLLVEVEELCAERDKLRQALQAVGVDADHTVLLKTDLAQLLATERQAGAQSLRGQAAVLVATSHESRARNADAIRALSVGGGSQ